MTLRPPVAPSLSAGDPGSARQARASVTTMRSSRAHGSLRPPRPRYVAAANASPGFRLTARTGMCREIATKA